MTRRQLDPALIQERLHEIQLLLADLVEVGEVDAERLRRERPRSYADSFDEIARAGVLGEELAAALRPSAGMRNVLVHDYLDVDHGKVSAAIPLALDQYGQYVPDVARWLLHNDPSSSGQKADQ